MNKPLLYIILLNYNGWQDTIECLESLQNISYPNYKIVVVDNESDDHSVNKIKKWCEGEIEVSSTFVEYNKNLKPVTYIEYDRETAEIGGKIDEEIKIKDLNSQQKLVLINSGDNLGFAGGNNIGIKYALENNTDYIMLLNNDTVVNEGFVEPLVDTVENKKEVGIVGGKIYYYDYPKDIAFGGGKIDLLKGSGYHFYSNKFKDPTEVSFLTGCLWLVQPEVFKKVGFMDENYFLYLEDTDFCYRIKKNGYKLIYNPNSVIYHKENKSTGRLSPLSIYYLTRNRPYFVHKNSNDYLNIILFWLFYLPTRLIRAISYGRKGKYIFKGLKNFIINDRDENCNDI
jgi:hypothetical protein